MYLHANKTLDMKTPYSVASWMLPSTKMLIAQMSKHPATCIQCIASFMRKDFSWMELKARKNAQMEFISFWEALKSDFNFYEVVIYAVIWLPRHKRLMNDKKIWCGRSRRHWTFVHIEHKDVLRISSISSAARSQTNEM